MSGLFDMFMSGDFDRKPMQPIMWPWPDLTDERIKALESELAETKRQLAEEKASADGHWTNANNIAKERDVWKEKAQEYACYYLNERGCICAGLDCTTCKPVEEELSDD